MTSHVYMTLLKFFNLRKNTSLSDMFSIFDIKPTTDLNKDRAVIYHEIGHAVMWFYYGQKIDRLIFKRRLSDSQLLASIICRPISGNDEDLLNASYQNPIAERLLGGDISARIATGADLRKISLDGVILHFDMKIHDIVSQLPERHDLVIALQLAHNAAQRDWLRWLTERHAFASKIIKANCCAIGKIAQELEANLPNRGEEILIAGVDLAAMLTRLVTSSTKSIG